jgi:hypothetical protein
MYFLSPLPSHLLHTCWTFIGCVLDLYVGHFYCVLYLNFVYNIVLLVIGYANCIGGTDYFPILRPYLRFRFLNQAVVNSSVYKCVLRRVVEAPYAEVSRTIVWPVAGPRPELGILLIQARLPNIRPGRSVWPCDIRL